MFSGEAEIQARRKTLSVLQDQARRMLDSARELSLAYSSLLVNNASGLKGSAERVRVAEDDIEGLRRVLTREVASIGAMMMNREDLLRASYGIEEIAGYISGIAFRLTQVKSSTLKSEGLERDIGELVDIAVEAVQGLNEVVRALAINPSAAIDLANGLIKIERRMDEKHRATGVKLMSEMNSIKELIILKDIITALEDLADRCMAASDAITILALGL